MVIVRYLFSFSFHISNIPFEYTLHDRRTGKCKCMAGFSGSSCERLDCHDQCNDRGICYSMKDFAGRTRYILRERLSFFHLFTLAFSFNAFSRNELSQQFTYTSRWDNDKIKGCQCDYPATGYDCSQSLCPIGDDPLTPGQVHPLALIALLCCKFHY